MGSYDSEGIGLGYIDPSDQSAKDISKMMDHCYTSSYPANAALWQQGSIDKRFKVGDQSLKSLIYGDNQYFQSRRFFFNLIRRQINMIAGYQRRNRKSTITIPLFDNDSLSDDYNTVLKYCENRDGFQEYLSQAFEGACDTGISLLHMYPDYTLDPISGDLFTDNVSYNNFLIDPYFRKQDLTDCNFIWRRRWVSKEQAKALLPDRDKEISKLMPSKFKDGRFPLQAELLNLDTANLFAYDEFHYRSSRKAKVIIDPKTGESVEWEPEEDEDENTLKQILKVQPWLFVKEIEVPTVKLAIKLGSKMMYHGANLLNIDPYPFIPLLTYHEPDIQSYQWRIQGVVRNLRDAQYLYNSRVVIMEDILRSQINSGWIYPIDSVVDPKAFRQSGQGFLVPLKSGHLPNELQRIEPPAIPQSMMELANMLSDDIMKISGVNEELMGSATDDKAGILSMLRQGAGLTTLQTIFDKLDYSQRLYGKIRLEAIRKKFSKGKVAKILNKEPDPNFFSSRAQQYTIMVEEGNYSASQRQTELQQLMTFKEMGMPIPDESIMKAAIITNKHEIIEQMQQMKEQQEQMMQQQQQAQMELQQKKDNAEVMLKYARSQSDMARADDYRVQSQERISKINQQQADAEHKRTQADLDLVKLLVELEDLDMRNLKNAFELAEQIKQARQIQENSVGGMYEEQR